jgi:hypothetical protein
MMKVRLYQLDSNGFVRLVMVVQSGSFADAETLSRGNN